jgi:hypothetical protein
VTRRYLTTLLSPCVVGIDLSSRAVDIVLLSENEDTAEWLSIPLSGATAWDRTRDIARQMPAGTWWDDVYLCAIEKPFGPSRLAQSVLMRAQGAILGAVPHRVEAWEVTPGEWKRHIGIPLSAKPSWGDFAPSLFDGLWPQDARDALGVALYARAVNSAGIARQGEIKVAYEQVPSERRSNSLPKGLDLPQPIV